MDRKYLTSGMYSSFIGFAYNIEVMDNGTCFFMVEDKVSSNRRVFFTSDPEIIDIVKTSEKHSRRIKVVAKFMMSELFKALYVERFIM